MNAVPVRGMLDILFGAGDGSEKNVQFPFSSQNDSGLLGEWPAESAGRGS
jgi:hypothetical protein